MSASPSLSPGATNPRDVAAPLFATTRKLRPTVLLVDDDSSVCKSICRVLSTEALQVISVRCVKDALHQISQHTPDLIMTDLCMAPLTGWDFIAHLKHHHPALPIFVITALPLPIVGGTNQDVTAFFQKPLDCDKLLAAIRRQLIDPSTGPNSSCSPL